MESNGDILGSYAVILSNQFRYRTMRAVKKTDSQQLRNIIRTRNIYFSF